MERLAAVIVLLLGCDRDAKPAATPPADNSRITITDGQFDLTWATRDCKADSDCVLTETRTCDCYCPETAINTAAAKRVAELSDSVKCPAGTDGETPGCQCESLAARCNRGECRAVKSD